MKDWYLENIEEPILPIVKLLRDNGFNTESSCGHELSVQCNLVEGNDIENLERLLLENGFHNFLITAFVRRVDGFRQGNSLLLNIGTLLDVSIRKI